MKGGWTLPEVLVALVLTGVIAAAAAGAVVAHRGVLATVLGRAQEDEAVRVVRGVLAEEARGGAPGDVLSAGGDSVSVRGYRSRALVCDPRPGSGWRVDSRGVRRGDPDKDSVRILGADGRWREARLTRVGGRPGPCDDPAAAETWEVEPAQEVPPLLLRSFERGSYHLAQGALRYRRGPGGRQPLTPELFDDRRSHLVLGSGELRIHLVPVGGGEGSVDRVVTVPLGREAP